MSYTIFVVMLMLNMLLGISWVFWRVLDFWGVGDLGLIVGFDCCILLLGLKLLSLLSDLVEKELNQNSLFG